MSRMIPPQSQRNQTHPTSATTPTQIIDTTSAGTVVHSNNNNNADTFGSTLQLLSNVAAGRQLETTQNMCPKMLGAKLLTKWNWIIILTFL